MRIVSICPSNTELLVYLGLTEQIVGIDNYSDWPASIQHLPKLGPDLDIDIDQVESLKPDLILASLSVPGMEKNIERLEERGLPYIILDPQSLDDIADDLLKLGQAVQIEAHAKKIVNRYRYILETYRKLGKTINDQPTIYWEWWPRPVFSPGGVNWLTEMTDIAGGRNLFAEKHTASYKTDWENIVTLDPDYICLIWVGVSHHKVKKEFVLQRQAARQLKAVRRDQVHILEEPYFCRPSPRLLIGLKRIAAILHPEVFPAFTPTDDILEH
ncbi:ABC transporter substrate-binding protein [Tuberibacillus sp. Marseille-P3662]|uniref:ABC transporter substrate-binding protein n=1 Tax=Tuberibacillus sp. Marseille-P3662 TaxID=1965358 RepID=UPI000A1CBA42|nr:cobalamin-binding protein [Tuberibacillus sp. Marseille-P3662]